MQDLLKKDAFLPWKRFEGSVEITKQTRMESSFTKK
jgi:hypothetical protein